MKNCRITVMKRTVYPDLSAAYEIPQEHPCELKLGQVFVTDTWHKPEGFCESAWSNLAPYVLALSSGADDLYDQWMQNPHSAMVSCNDGFRPVTFYVEALEESDKEG